MSITLNLAHIFFTGPLCMYIGFYMPESPWIYKVLLILGVFLAFYFLFVIITKPLSQYHAWLLVHLGLFIPLLIWVGIKQTKAPRIVFSFLLAIGCAAVLYHIIRLSERLYP